jgi:hypothetical protein
MPSTSAADRIGYLKSLQGQWATELQQLARVHPERALHLAEALDDLKTVIGCLEAESRTERRAPVSSGVP